MHRKKFYCLSSFLQVWPHHSVHKLDINIAINSKTEPKLVFVEGKIFIMDLLPTLKEWILLCTVYVLLNVPGYYLTVTD